MSDGTKAGQGRTGDSGGIVLDAAGVTVASNRIVVPPSFGAPGPSPARFPGTARPATPAPPPPWPR